MTRRRKEQPSVRRRRRHRQDELGPYRKFYLDFWNDERVRELSPPPPSGQGLFAYLICGKHTQPIPGLTLARPSEIFAYLGWPFSEQQLDNQGLLEKVLAASQAASQAGYAAGSPAADRALAEVVHSGLALIDDRAGVIWLPGGLKRNPPQSIHVIQSWVNCFRRIPECPLKKRIHSDICRYLEEYEGLWMDTFLAGSPAAYAAGSRAGSPATESREQKSLPPSSETSAGGRLRSGGFETGVVSASQAFRRQPGLLGIESESSAGEEASTGNPSAPSAPDRQPSGDHQIFVAEFTRLFAAYRGGAKPTWGGRGGSIVSALLKQHSVDECIARARRMFEIAPHYPAESPDIGTLSAFFDKFAPPVDRLVGGRVAVEREYPQGDQQ